MKNKKTGRKPMPIDKRLSGLINIRVTEQFHTMLKEDSIKSGIPMSRKIVGFIISGMAGERKKEENQEKKAL